MYREILRTGQTAPAAHYRDIVNGGEVRLKSPRKLPAGPDGCTTLYVTLARPRRRIALRRAAEKPRRGTDGI
jgi:hypothetical protein